MLGAIVILGIFLIFSLIIANMMDEPVLIVIGLAAGLLLVFVLWWHYPSILIPFPGG